MPEHMSDEKGHSGEEPRRVSRKLLVFVDSGSVSGPVLQLAAVIPHLLTRGYEIHCATFQRKGRPQITSSAFLEAKGATVTTLVDTHAFDLSLASRCVDLVSKIRPDVIETHSYRPAVIMAACRITRRIQIPWVGFFHGTTNESARMRLYNRLDHLALRFADTVVVMSERHRSEKKAFRTSVKVIYNAAITDASSSVTSAELSERLAEFPAPRIGVVGRLSPEKGVDLALDAWETMVDSGFPGTLVIAGDGAERAALAQKVRNASLEKRVVFLGHIDGAKNLYPLLDLLLIPSRSEGLPNTLLEALQHPSIAIVSTRVGAVPELAEGLAVVSLVDVGDIDQMVESIRLALTPGASQDREASRKQLLSKVALATRVDAIAQTYVAVDHGT